ncbi:MAG: hypothetical protein HY760_07485 [Nitrospirae bacterium]|nr:hypothetical protein [Nitrospirota bacterium]
MATLDKVTDSMIELLGEHGSLTLTEVEKEMGVSFNLIFLAIDGMVAHHQVTLERRGKDYTLSLAA